MDGKVFTTDTKELMIDAASKGISAPFWIKPFVKPGLRIALNFIDKKGDKFIPDKIDELINQSITEALNGNLDDASNKAGTALNLIVDVPLIEEDTEHTLFVDSIKLIIRLIQNWIQKKKNK